MNKTPPEPRRVRWIFFDIGDVLVNEDRLRFRIFKKLETRLKKKKLGLTLEEILSAREDLIMDHADEHPHDSIAKLYLTEKEYHEWHRDIKQYIHTHLTRELILVPGMKTLLKALSRHYALGLIADQPHQTLNFLSRQSILRYFRVHAISGVLNQNKPRKKVFEWAINKAGCSFGQAVMIGDRLDNDIVPAKQLDMITIQARWNTYKKGYTPRTTAEALYLDSLDRTKNWRVDPASQGETADIIVEKVSDLHRAIESLG